MSGVEVRAKASTLSPVTEKNKVSIIQLSIELLWMFAWAIALLVTYDKHKDSKCSDLALWCILQGISYLVFTIFFLSLFWGLSKTSLGIGILTSIYNIAVFIVGLVYYFNSNEADCTDLYNTVRVYWISFGALLAFGCFKGCCVFRFIGTKHIP
eukprot:c18629_g1_i3.p1 GENE.c18629_g1_i3~~c18629_g1_i3.p1  ORF type:complete len:154 (+),score=21.64 c18629_g1_i3:32-493(+)